MPLTLRGLLPGGKPARFQEIAQSVPARSLPTGGRTHVYPGCFGGPQHRPAPAPPPRVAAGRPGTLGPPSAGTIPQRRRTHREQ